MIIKGTADSSKQFVVFSRGAEGTRVCEALGLNAENVTDVKIHVDMDGVAHMEVTHTLEADQLRTAVGILVGDILGDSGG